MRSVRLKSGAGALLGGDELSAPSYGRGLACRRAPSDLKTGGEGQRNALQRRDYRPLDDVSKNLPGKLPYMLQQTGRIRVPLEHHEDEANVEQAHGVVVHLPEHNNPIAHPAPPAVVVAVPPEVAVEGKSFKDELAAAEKKMMDTIQSDEKTPEKIESLGKSIKYLEEICSSFRAA